MIIFSLESVSLHKYSGHGEFPLLSQITKMIRFRFISCRGRRLNSGLTRSLIYKQTNNAIYGFVKKALGKQSQLNYRNDPNRKSNPSK